MEKMVSIEKFAERYKVSVGTVISHFELIYGAYIKDGVYMIPDSSRYPYFLKNNKNETREDKKLIILRATNIYKYVDQDTVNLSEFSFNTIVRELLECGCLKENGSDNPYGLNRYDPTERTEEIIKMNRIKAIKAIKEIANLAGTTIGTTVGAGVATYKNMTM